MGTQAQTNATVKFVKEKNRSYTIRYHKVYEKEDIEFLDALPNKTKFIKEAVREKRERLK